MNRWERIRLLGATAALVLMSILSIGAAPTSAPAESPVEGELIRRNANDAPRRPTTATASADTLAGKSGSAIDVQRVVLALAIVMAAIFAARWLMKRMYPGASMGRNSQVIRVISRSVVGPKQQFLLVQIGRRLVLVGDSGANMSSLAEIDDADEVASLVGELQSESSTSSVSAFGSLFRKAGNEFEHSDVQQDEPVQREDEAPARELVAAAGEITGLMDRVRMLSKRIRQT